MQQLNIQYFFPLTEQIDLDLDFKPCSDYDEDQRKKQTYTGYTLNNWTANGTTSWAAPHTIQFHANSDSVGYWKVGEGLQMHNKKKPNWLHQQMTKIFFGWKWMNK
jgi:hypothetical protein